MDISRPIELKACGLSHYILEVVKYLKFAVAKTVPLSQNRQWTSHLAQHLQFQVFKVPTVSNSQNCVSSRNRYFTSHMA